MTWIKFNLILILKRMKLISSPRDAQEETLLFVWLVDFLTVELPHSKNNSINCSISLSMEIKLTAYHVEI
jgi:hypothetical protein